MTHKKEKCFFCDQPSLPPDLPGLQKAKLCKYHYDIIKYGQKWADRLRKAEEKKKKMKREEY